MQTVLKSTGKNAKVPPEEVAEDIRICRCKVPPKQEKKRNKKTGAMLEEFAKFQIGVALRAQNQTLMNEVEAEILGHLVKLGGIRKFGAPPRGALEREARVLLAKFQK